jgi:hypothetical protein
VWLQGARSCAVPGVMLGAGARSASTAVSSGQAIIQSRATRAAVWHRQQPLKTRLHEATRGGGARLVQATCAPDSRDRRATMPGGPARGLGPCSTMQTGQSRAGQGVALSA